MKTDKELRGMKREPGDIKFGKISLTGIFLFLCFFGFSQEEDKKAVREAQKYLKEAEEAREENDFSTAEAMYRQAIAKDPSNAEAQYNLGNLYYNEEMPDGAIKRHAKSGELFEEKSLKHRSFHNQGNAFMKQKKYPEAIEAYKNALRNNPSDEETRYNLAVAKQMHEKEQDQKGGGDDQDQNQGENQDQENENQDQQGEQGEKEQNEQGDQQENDPGDEEGKEDKKEGDDKEGDKGEPKDQKQQEDKGDKQEEQQQPAQQQPVPGQLSPQQIKNLLEAMGNEEKKVQEKINAEKIKGAKTKSEKDW